MSRIRIALSGSALVLLLLLVYSFELTRPTALDGLDMELEGHVPATLYLPDNLLGTMPYLVPEMPAKLPGVVLAHGYSGDRQQLANLARALIMAGYAVITIDLRGHGDNRNPYREDWGSAGHLATDIGAGVRYLQRAENIDNDRIVIGGHSMGARASLAYGTHVDDVAGMVLIAGGWELLGPHRPRNALFVHAERELPIILAAAKSVSAKLAGVEASESGVTYGEFANGTAVRRVEVAGTNHGTIIGSDEALNEIVAWLDNASGHAPRTEPPAFPVAPFGSGILWLLFLLVMPGLGEVMARLAPRSAEAEIAASRWNLGILVLSLAIALPLVGIAPPGVLMGLSDADVNVSFLALSGLFLIVILMLLNRIGSAPRSVTVSLSVALIGVLILFVLFGQVIAGLHGIGLTPEKTLLTICSAAFLLPFSFGFQTLTQSKSWTRALALRLAGRAIILAAILVGNSLGLFSFAGTIAFGMLLIGYVLIEIVLTGFYARSDNTLTGAGFEALTVAWLLAVMLPSNF